MFGIQSNDAEVPYFSPFMSTKRLLQATHEWRPVECDETYKLVREGYAITVLGQTDADRHFHLRGIGISTRSVSTVGEFLFQTWNDNVEGQRFEPVAYLGDAAAAFANGSYRVFHLSDDERLTCFAHVFKVLFMAFLFHMSIIFSFLICSSQGIMERMYHLRLFFVTSFVVVFMLERMHLHFSFL